MSVTATRVPMLSDNYAWLLRDSATGATAIVDPAEAAPGIVAIEAAGGRLDLILLTHHHGDHIDGAAEIGAKIVGARADAHRLPKLDIALAEGEHVGLGESEAVVIDTPGHTRGHIAYFFANGDILCSGDTLFSLGCGRLFEGDAADMYASMRKLSALPGDSLVCCGHEYTQSNAKFALSIDPDNEDLKARAAQVDLLRARGEPTVPSRLDMELKTNPYLRAKSADELGRIRKAKDHF
ncbi:MAG TPA: hydroxyacylglutathione hydrolase [Acetobacteraceae bacterium]|nr:hydroxyacylglutathione hydrolase [Acetobacteraceae bacterium]